MAMLRAAVIGVGSMGQHHARVYNELEDVALAAVADADEATVHRVARLHKVPAYISYVEMLEAEKPDLVSIAVPTSLHHAAAMAAIERGMHALVEKPIAETVYDAEELISSARRQGVLLAAGHIERFNPAVAELKRRLDEGELGTIFQLHARRLSPYPNRVQDAGVVLDLAIHELDIMTCLDESPVERVYAEVRTQFDAGREDMLAGLLRFASGAIGVLDINWLTPSKVRTLSVTGERGMFEVNYLHQDLLFYENTDVRQDGWAILEVLGVGEGNMTKYRISKEEPLRRELRSFVQAVQRSESPQVTGEDGLKALRLALALVKSAYAGQSVQLSAVGQV
jgi:UDP-N-acetylglucosamine 3-dehydrogenase